MGDLRRSRGSGCHRKGGDWQICKTEWTYMVLLEYESSRQNLKEKKNNQSTHTDSLYPKDDDQPLACCIPIGTTHPLSSCIPVISNAPYRTWEWIGLD